jgi:hypothetical protein
LLAVGAWGAPFFQGLQRMWSKRAAIEGKMASTIRLVRLLRPRKERRSPPRIEP